MTSSRANSGDALLSISSALTVEGAPECGGSLTRCDFKMGSKRFDILRPAIESQVNALSPHGASCFPMIPYAGRPRGGKFDLGGHQVVFPVNAPGERHSYHGERFRRPWSCQ